MRAKHPLNAFKGAACDLLEGCVTVVRRIEDVADSAFLNSALGKM